MKRFSAFLTNLTAQFPLLAWASFPALALTAFGLYQLEVHGAGIWAAALGARWIMELAFLGLCFALLQLIGLKNKWLWSILLYLYYISMTADFVLLWYFKERFGAKYVDTLQGGDYDFLTDWRIMSYLIAVLIACFLLVRRYARFYTRKIALQQATGCAAVIFLLYTLNPLALLPKPYDFLTRYLLPPSPVYTAHALLAKQPSAYITEQLPPQMKAVVQEYPVFSAKNTDVGGNYRRVILIALESLSAKYMHRFNPLIPPQASAGYDRFFEHYPATTLHTVTLSTLYGLSVIFTSHPNAKLSYENAYPISFVKELQKQGFRTAFFRGAQEDYMDENILFQQAGFEEVKGKSFFQTLPDYRTFIDWWGLTDRKLFEYAADYLQQHTDEKTFLTLLTVDTHVPLGRADYLGQAYEEIDAPFYQVPTMPRAFARENQDLQYFIDLLQKKGLFDDQTIIFLTGDHPSYSNTPTHALFRPYQPVFDRIPFFILTARPLPQPLAQNELASQLDIAPTILDVLNLPMPRGFFGRSLFDHTAARSVFDLKEDYAVITTEQGRRIIPFSTTKPQEKMLLELLRTFWIEPAV